MVFVDSVEKGIALGKYLQFFLPDNLKYRGEKIIISFLSNLEAKIKTDYLEDFVNGNIKILIYTKVVGMVVDIPNIRQVIK